MQRTNGNVGLEDIEMPAKTATTEQGVEVDAGIVDFISHLNSCGWVFTTSSCSGLKVDHYEDVDKDDTLLTPSVCFMGKSFSEEGAMEDKSTLLPSKPTGDDIHLINAIQEYS